MGEGELICFSSSGQELWRFKGGGELKCGSTVYSTDYRVRGFIVHDINNDGKMEIFVVIIHNPLWPTQLVSLSSDGAVLGEYWHAGHLRDMDFADLNKDGQDELICAGLNNEYQKGCLIVFDPNDLRGFSPQVNEEFRCADMNPGSEKYYLLFPRTDVDILAHPVESVGRMDIFSNQNISIAMTISTIIYFLDHNLIIQSVIFSHGFMQLHREAVLAGKINSVLDDNYKTNLMKGIQYFDGQGWTSKPIPVRQPRLAGLSLQVRENSS